MEQKSDESSENESDDETPDPPSKWLKLSLIHINCKNLKHKLAKLEKEAEEHDVVFLKETWLHKDIPNNELVLEGFGNLVRKDKEEDRYGGMVIYCRSKMPVKERNDIQVRGTESVWIQINLEEKTLLPGCIYGAPNEPIEYWEKLSELLKTAKVLNMTK